MSSEPRKSDLPPFPHAIGLEGKLYVVMHGIGADGRRSERGGGLRGRTPLSTGKGHLRSLPFTPGDAGAMRGFVAARDALRLTVYEASSLPLAATVQLISEWPSGRKVIHATVSDERYWV